MIKGFKNVKVMTPDGIINTNIEILNGKIKSLDQRAGFDGLTFNEEVIVIPGFIDEHMHGVNGSDCMDADVSSLQNIAKSLTKEGTTSFLATTMTQSVDNIENALKNIHDFIVSHNHNGAEVIGIHLEGPFLNKDACGAQPAEYIVNPSVEVFRKYQTVSGNTIKLVTIAPEVVGGMELIEYCSQNNIVASIGHTKAKYPQVYEAIKKGATQVTHCYNAMTGLHHREVGVVGATLLHDELQAEIIADGIHVHEKAIALLYKNKGKERMTLITDSMRAKGLKDGVSELGGQKVFVKNGQATLEDGTLAGSVLKMIDAVNNVMKFLNISIEDAVAMASTNPAKKLGVFDHKGSIEVGKDADFVVLDKNYQILMTICKGRIEYSRE
jgi:N-acetylglucosamine-6-phosphate deacetylase